MTFLHAQEDRAAALRAYEAYASRLKQDYELEPSPETRALVDAIRREKPTTATAAPRDPQPSSREAPKPEPTRPRRPRAIAPLLVAAALLAALGLGVVIQRRSAAAPAVRRIAVLPLHNLTGDSTQDYFVDGMHEALIGELARIEAAGVISRTSVLRFRGAERPSLPAIATQLEVDAVVEGRSSRRETACGSPSS